MSRTVIAPIIALVALLVKSAFGIEVGDELQNQITDAVLLGVTLYGIITNHKKEVKTDGEEGNKEA